MMKPENHPARLYAPGPHVGLCVTDLDRSREFYTRLLGFLWDSDLVSPGAVNQKLLRLPGCGDLTAEYLWREGFCLEFLFYPGVGRLPNPSAPLNALGISYLALEARDLPEVLRRLRAAGADVLENRVFPDDTTPQLVFVRDPDGELLQIGAMGAASASRALTSGWYPVKPHLKLVVRDIERSIRFYRDVMQLHYEGEAGLEGEGIERILGLPGARIRNAALWRAGFCLLLRQFQAPPPLPKRGGAMNQLGFTHLSFHFPDLMATVRETREFGAEVLEDTLVEFNGRPTAIFLRDPDGQLIEALQL